MATLELKKAIKRYSDLQVIHGIDLKIDHGEFTVFVGPSGCGKSTLLRMIAGLEAISDGDVEIDGERVNDVPAAQRGLAMVFQSYALYPHMSVRQNLSFGLENLKTPKDEITRRVDDAARMLQIEQFLNRRPGQLSGGQRQRVAIGRAVVREPRIFLFDEPLSNLDAELRVQMRVEIADLHKRLGNTMIYVTHDQVEAMTMADKIVVLRLGKIEQVGKPLDLYNTPANKFVAGFIGSPRMNFLNGVIRGGENGSTDIEIEGGAKVSAPVSANGQSGDGSVAFGIRPEHISPVSPDESDLRVTVQNIEQLGSDSFLYCALETGTPLTIHAPGQTTVRRGETIGASFPRELCHVFDTGTEAALPRTQ